MLLKRFREERRVVQDQPQDQADGRERLLRAAVRHLATHSAAQLRVTAIADEAGVALGLIRHHFGSRDGLVAAAQQRRLEGATREDIAGVRQLLEADDVAAVWAGFEHITRMTLDRARAKVRLSRLAAVATAHGRTEASRAIGATFGDLLDDMTAVIDEAIERGLITTDLPPRAVATFIQSYALGLIVHDLDPDAVDDDDLVRVILTALRAILSPA
jgi:AcrR family transcriptional regulator